MKAYHLRRRTAGVALPDDASPVQSARGLRELFCVNYKPCLDYSIRKRWVGFDCGECQCEERVPHVPVQRDSNYD